MIIEEQKYKVWKWTLYENMMHDDHLLFKRMHKVEK